MEGFWYQEFPSIIAKLFDSSVKDTIFIDIFPSIIAKLRGDAGADAFCALTFLQTLRIPSNVIRSFNGKFGVQEETFLDNGLEGWLQR